MEFARQCRSDGLGAVGQRAIPIPLARHAVDPTNSQAGLAPVLAASVPGSPRRHTTLARPTAAVRARSRMRDKPREAPSTTLGANGHPTQAGAVLTKARAPFHPVATGWHATSDVRIRMG